MATLLAVVQEFCSLRALPSPTTVMGSVDDQVLQLKSLLQQGLKEMADRGAWEELTNEATWTTVASETQGAITTVAPNGFLYFLPDTFWDRTNKIPLTGPLTPQQWQQLKAMIVTGPRYSFRVRGGNFIVQPAPTAGYTWAFEYISRNFLLNGVTYKNAFTDDADTILLPEQIVQADLLWRWKKEKGLSYAEDFNSAERLVNKALARSGGKNRLYMHNAKITPQPGIFVPIGNWPLP